MFSRHVFEERGLANHGRAEWLKPHPTDTRDLPSAGNRAFRSDAADGCIR
jgi:hypothetical protein